MFSFSERICIAWQYISKLMVSHLTINILKKETFLHHADHLLLICDNDDTTLV